MGQIENELIVNPTRRELEKSSMNLVVAAAGGNLVVMLEGGANDVLQQDLLKAIKLGTNVSSKYSLYYYVHLTFYLIILMFVH